MEEMSAYSGRSVHEEILQKLLSSVHAHEAHLAAMSNPNVADSVNANVTEARRKALERGEIMLFAKRGPKKA